MTNPPPTPSPIISFLRHFVKTIKVLYKCIYKQKFFFVYFRIKCLEYLCIGPSDVWSQPCPGVSRQHTPQTRCLVPECRVITPHNPCTLSRGVASSLTPNQGVGPTHPSSQTICSGVPCHHTPKTKYFVPGCRFIISQN